jgi:hypothetical protein
MCFLGYGPTDAEGVKHHPFFKSINWDDLLRRNIPAPFVPNINNNLDVSNFSVEFTEMPPVDSPADVPVAFDVFKGYSFTGASILFLNNHDQKDLPDDLFRPSPNKKPTTSNLVGCILKVRNKMLSYKKSSEVINYSKVKMRSF